MRAEDLHEYKRDVAHMMSVFAVLRHILDQDTVDKDDKEYALLLIEAVFKAMMGRW